METYVIALISISVAALFILLSFIIGGLVFFFAIFKRKPFNELGTKKKMSLQRKEVIEERREAIDYLKKQPYVPYERKADDDIILKGKLFCAIPDGQNVSSSKRLVICVHGFGSHSFRAYAAMTPYLQSLGLDVLLIDERAHGESEGKYTGFSVLDKDDLIGWVDMFKDTYEKIYLNGVSMGASTCALAAAERQDDINGLIFDCGFTSPIEEFDASVRGVNRHLNCAPIFFFGDLWCRQILGFSFKSVSALAAMPSVKCKVLFVHGDKDKKVPREMSDRLFAACGSLDKKQEIFSSAEHTASWHVETERYKKLLKEFFEEK